MEAHPQVLAYQSHLFPQLPLFFILQVPGINKVTHPKGAKVSFDSWQIELVVVRSDGES